MGLSGPITFSSVSVFLLPPSPLSSHSHLSRSHLSQSHSPLALTSLADLTLTRLTSHTHTSRTPRLTPLTRALAPIVICTHARALARGAASHTGSTGRSRVAVLLGFVLMACSWQSRCEGRGVLGMALLLGLAVRTGSSRVVEMVLLLQLAVKARSLRVLEMALLFPSCHVMSCHVLSCLVLSCLVLSCLVLSCLACLV